MENINILVVTAHPDDEAFCAGAIYKLVHSLGVEVDLALVTNGEGGFRYADFGEAIYGLKLTNEAIGRAYLPAIRKRELMDSGSILGIRNYFFLDQCDHSYTRSVEESLAVWDEGFIRSYFRKILKVGGYDFVFLMLPYAETHGHHKAATILMLETIWEMPQEKRPIALGGKSTFFLDKVSEWGGLEGYPITSVDTTLPILEFDKEQPLGHKGLLHYGIIVNWVIAAHKTQGTMQRLINKGRYEQYFFFNMNDLTRFGQAESLFTRLAESPIEGA